MSSGFSVTQALWAAVSFVPRAWQGAWLVLGLMLVATVGLSFFAMSHQLKLISLLIVLLLFLLKLVAQGALYRIALFGRDARAEGLGFGGLQFGWPELRLLWATVVVSLFVLMIVATVGIVFAIAFSMSGLASGYEDSMAALIALVKRHSGADYVFIGYLAFAGLYLIFLSLKLVLVPVANIGGRKLVTLNALGLTTGYVGRLFLGLAALVVPFLLIAGGVAHTLPLKGNGGILVHMALLLLDIFGLFPLIVGFLTSAYRQIMAIRSK
ncbi:MAG: hypothetical protein QM647_07560 [Asticcacaulis sp.]|uniref:hypothetical protein n=1 Tax=Asticcacaulis sp. TaxID=1872648 RepID=UPI0039E51267